MLCQCVCNTKQISQPTLARRLARRLLVKPLWIAPQLSRRDTRFLNIRQCLNVKSNFEQLPIVANRYHSIFFRDVNSTIDGIIKAVNSSNQFEM